MTGGVLRALQTNPRMSLLCAWCGPLFVTLYGLGMVIAGRVPPTDPDDSPEQVVQDITDHETLFRLGMVLMCFGAAFAACWAVAIAAQQRRTELGAPVLTYCAMGSAFFLAIDASLIPTVWGAMSFRAGEVDPEITMTLNDLGWFMVLFPWQWGGGIWFVAVALSALTDKSPEPVFPRWVGYMSLWFCLLTFSDSLIVFFDSGPFAYNGVMAFYVPFTVLFIWVIALTWVTIKAITRQRASDGDTFTPLEVTAPTGVS